MTQIKGTIKLIKPTEHVSDKFSKRECVITTDEKYPQEIMVEFHKDNCSKLDGMQEGQYAEVETNIRSKEFNGRYYINLVGWKITTATSGLPPKATAPNGPIATAGGVAEDQSLPF